MLDDFGFFVGLHLFQAFRGFLGNAGAAGGDPKLDILEFFL